MTLIFVSRRRKGIRGQWFREQIWKQSGGAAGNEPVGRINELRKPTPLRLVMHWPSVRGKRRLSCVWLTNFASDSSTAVWCRRRSSLSPLHVSSNTRGPASASATGSKSTVGDCFSLLLLFGNMSTGLSGDDCEPISRNHVNLPFITSSNDL